MAQASSRTSVREAVILPKSGDRYWLNWMICAVLAGLVWFVFGQTLHHNYVNYDDPEYVFHNPETLKGLTPDGILRAFTVRELGLWNPVIILSFLADSQFYGTNPAGYHFTNLILHLASVLILFHVLRQITGSVWRSAFVAALFAIHPLRVESVAWISERKDVLSGLFFMLTLWAYLFYLKKPGAIPRYGLLILVFGLGLMAKPMLVTVPFVLLLIDYWPLRRLFEKPPGKGLAVNWPVVREKIPLLILSFALSLAIIFSPDNPTPDTIKLIPFGIRMQEAPVAFVTYLGQIFWPANLALIYPHSDEKILWWPVSVLLILSLTLAFFALRKKYPCLLMGWLWNMGMLFPVCGVVQISRHWQADHYTYLPQIGIYVIIAWGIAELTASWKHRILVLATSSCLVVVLFATTARFQCSYWKNNETIWKHNIAITPDNDVAHSNLGTALMDEERYPEALAHFMEAIRINPRDFTSYGNLGVIYLKTGETERALQYFNKVQEINPHDVKNFNNFAWILATNPKSSGRDGKKALELALLCCSHPKGNNPWFVDTLAAAYAEVGDFPKAIEWAQAALKLNTDDGGLKAQIQAHLESYQKGIPWRDNPTQRPIPAPSQESAR